MDLRLELAQTAEAHCEYRPLGMVSIRSNRQQPEFRAAAEAPAILIQIRSVTARLLMIRLACASG